jgi:hypothetical protein
VALSGPAAALLSLAALVAGTAALARGWRAVRETTLKPAWMWAVATLVGWAGVEIAAGLVGKRWADWTGPLRFAVAVLSFCPIVAVLGAKRPQHAAWSFVVLAFWGITALPVAETLLLQRGQPLEIGDARSWFLWILVLLAPINYGPTRHGPSALLVAAGQFLALSEHLPLVRREFFAGQESVGLVLLALGLAIVRPNRRPAANPYDRLWRDFRDTFGLFWALRVQERVRAAGQTGQWPVQLVWSGFVENSTGQSVTNFDPATEPTLRATLRGLLRRFVSGEWIADRLGQDVD